MKLFQLDTIQTSRRRRGFALMIAGLIASIVLAMAAAIYDISIKQLSLSSLSRESQFAFYAADTAAECALYWDSRDSYFATTTPAGVTPICDGPTPLVITETHGYTSPYTYPYTMTFSFQPNGYCANVTVEKCDGAIATDGTCTHAVPAVVHTVIHADGYNTSCAAISTSRVALQRTVELAY